MPVFGWIIAAISACLIFILTEAKAFSDRYFANRKFAEFLCTCAKPISVFDRLLPDRIRLSLALHNIGTEFYRRSELKAQNEWTPPRYDPIAGAGAALVFSGILLATRRPGVAALVTLLLVVGLIRLSKLKFEYVRMNLHAYDFVHFITRSNVVFFWKTYRATAIKIFSAIALGVILLSTLAAFEPAKVSAYRASLVFLVALLLFSLAVFFSRRFPSEKGDWDWFEQPVNLIKFTESVFETIHVWRRGGVLAAVPATQGFPELARVAPKLKRQGPNIILILNESTFPPWLHQSTTADANLKDFFRSIDGSTRGLRVETFGGASWRSEFSVLTGIPTGCYGDFGSHVFHWATNKIHETLPIQLKRFGYRTAMIWPVDENFIGSGRFYRSIGIDEIIDRPALGTTEPEPDDFYLKAAIDWLSHHEPGPRPAFLYLSTMWNHSPHDVRAFDDNGERWTTKISDTEFDEYLRRLRSTCVDYANFRAELARRFLDREFLIVHFGDHQPTFVSKLFEPPQEGRSLHSRSHRELFYQTYFVIDAVNFTPVIDARLPETIEAAYLGTVLLEAAGIPPDGLQGVRRELMMKNNGRLFFADGQLAEQLNHRMLFAGMITPH